MLELTVAFSLVAVFYAYAGYPLLLLLLRRVRPRQRALPAPASATVIIACRNEAASIERKLENTLQLRPPASDGNVQIIVASDASDDGTDALVQQFSERGVQLVRLAQRGGKEQAQAAALEHACGDFVLFTDAKTRLDADCLERLAGYFVDASIGAVSTEDRIEDAAVNGSGEGFYVRYEMWLRRLESDFDSVVGLSGSGFAIRRELCTGLRPDVPSDFALLLSVRRHGLRGVLAPDVFCYYKSVATAEQEFHRKVRTALRGIATLMSCREVLNPLRFGAFSWQVASHKLMRWLVPLFLVIATLGVPVLAVGSPFFAVALIVELVCYGLALLGFVVRSLRHKTAVKVPLFFIVVNAAIAVAWVRYLSGARQVTWNPSERPADLAS